MSRRRLTALVLAGLLVAASVSFTSRYSLDIVIHEIAVLGDVGDELRR